MMRNTSISDDRPLTAVTVVEDPSKCPSGFTVVTKTYDSLSDADLWKDNGFFSKKVTRYLCVSKENSICDYFLENLAIVNEKELPPEGFGTITKTIDSDQKAWKKKQMCFKLSRRTTCVAVVTDVILLNNKSRRAPDGYHSVGELNGLLLCVKLRPAATVFDNIVPTSISSCNSHSSVNGNGLNSLTDEPHNYEKLVVKPVRPAPVVPMATNSFDSSYHGLQGVPFMLNSRLEATTRTLLASLPQITIKTKEEIEKEYSYDFRTERQLCMF